MAQLVAILAGIRNEISEKANRMEEKMDGNTKKMESMNEKMDGNTDKMEKCGGRCRTWVQACRTG